MSVLVILLLASLGVAVLFLVAFLWATNSGQFDDTVTPSWRVIGDDDEARTREADDRQKPDPPPLDSTRNP